MGDGKTNAAAVVRGQRAIRALLGVRATKVRALIEYDAARGRGVFVRSAECSTVRAQVGDIWRLYREWEEAQRLQTTSRCDE